MTEQQKYDPEVEYNEIREWIATTLGLEDAKYMSLCEKIEGFALHMYEKGKEDNTNETIERIIWNIK